MNFNTVAKDLGGAIDAMVLSQPEKFRGPVTENVSKYENITSAPAGNDFTQKFDI